MTGGITCFLPINLAECFMTVSGDRQFQRSLCLRVLENSYIAIVKD